MKDSKQTVSVALPNAANTSTTNVIDLRSQAVRPFTEQFRVKLSTTQATGANSKNITCYLQGSNESNGANAANIPGLGPLVIAGNSANYPAASLEVQLPPNTDKRYLVGKATGEANGGNAGDGTLTVEIII